MGSKHYVNLRYSMESSVKSSVITSINGKYIQSLEYLVSNKETEFVLQIKNRYQ